MSIQTTGAGVPFLRTPEERFADLPDFPYEPNYLEVDGLRMAYLDEGPRDGAKPTMLLLHGEPAWSFLYRRMIPVFVDAGYRIIAPDLIGFGRSDKPAERAAYTYEGHVAWLTEFLDRLTEADPGIGPFVSFNQDWGGLIGLRLAAATPERFSHLVIGNTALPFGESLGPGFDFWLDISQTMDPFDCGALIARGANEPLSEAEQNAYRAPFPDESFMAAAREFPCLVPITPEHGSVAENIAARAVLREWTDPVLLLWGTTDPVLGHLHDDFLDLIPGTAGQPHQLFEAGHFIQDFVGAPLADAIVNWLVDLE